MNKHPIRNSSMAALTVVAVLASCASPTDQEEGAPPEGGSESTNANVQVAVGTMPLADLAPFYYALNEGLFEEAGLDVEAEISSQGAAHIAAMTAGHLDLTYSNFVSVLQGAQQGLPLKIVRENNRSGPQGIYVKDGSPIESVDDLAGQTIAINSLGNIQELTSRAVLEFHGVDLDTVEFAEIPPPEMGAALDRELVDAAWLVEPFLTQAEEEGSHRVVSAFEGPTENLPVAGWVTNEKFLTENRSTVDKFVSVMDKAMADAEGDASIVAETIPTYTQIPAEVAENLAEPALTPVSDLSDFQVLHDLMVQYDLLNEPIDVDALMYVQ